MDKNERFPKPNPAATYAEFKILDASGSPLRTPREDWAGARTRVSQSPEWKKWSEERRAFIDDWMAQRRDRVEWVAGWWHDFVSPKDGSFLTWTPDEPGPETLRSPSDPKVALTPKIFGGWVYVFRSNHGQRMLEAARLFRLTGEKKYADWAASQLDFYADNYMKWPLQQRSTKPDASKSRLMWQSLDEASTLTRHIEVARLLWDSVTPERRTSWGDKLFKPQAEMLNQSYLSYHNIGCWQRSAQGMVALLYNDADLWEKAVNAPYGIKGQLAGGMTSDYLWYEQSLHYNSFVVSALLPFFLMAGLSGRENDIKHEMMVAENLMLAPLALRFPSGDLPSPADGSRHKAPERGLFADTCRIFPTEIGVYESRKTRSWPELIEPVTVSAKENARLTKEPGIAPATTRNMESSRMALIVKDGWQLYFHYGQLLASHAQAEALTYELWHGVTDLTHDTSTVGYGSPLHKEYYTQGLNHNVPLVGGLGQSGWAEGELLEWSPEKGRVSARQPKYRPGVSATRTLTIADNRVTDTALVEMTDAALPNAPLGLTLHIQGKTVVPDTFQPAQNDITVGRPEGFKYWTNTRVSPQPAMRFSFLVHDDDHTFRVTIQASIPCKLFHGVTPDAPPQKRESLYMESVTPQRKATFTTVWEEARP